MKHKLFIAALLLTSTQIVAKNSIETIIEKYNVKNCHSELKAMAEDVIGSKKHRLLVSNQTSKNEFETLLVTGVLEYKDRQSHITFSMSHSAQHCEVTYKESFAVKNPCIVVREEVFKKWLFKGKLNDHTHVFSHKRDENFVGYMTSTKDGSYCLVSRQKKTS
ncbi:MULTISPECIES: hypothetical protein [Pseudoalteromonas]|uniref:Uncharacterized protein n=1 Tax=Pseudoalteromonas luteoviolacea (strain 2ta16) TaxID=1353533 RepID=V4H6M5_PSEL2|nr:MULTISPECIES: hypothetical protein [Pseudoalteromonas]ESP93151.1 hypothetical protein PL2TA16_03372 [Pseudoalteromonas luteoviolacea 2ta16]KZN37024.1 hypothetical protein N483_21500 [Pseudoalteromonas luteoviolacea NCIMB 1944]MCG7549952.1 hypothetical protein [Pseudoalteromonas sp. Of7M-16]